MWMIIRWTSSLATGWLLYDAYTQPSIAVVLGVVIGIAMCYVSHKRLMCSHGL